MSSFVSSVGINCPGEQIAAGEAKNPRRNLPKAIKRVYIRILLFYIGGTAVISLLVPSNDPDLNLKTGTAAASPFVIAIQRAGIKGLPSVRSESLITFPFLKSQQVINACLLTSAWSAASSDLYTSSRALCEFINLQEDWTVRRMAVQTCLPI